MATWSSDELDRIGAAVELDLESLRPDGTLRDPVTMWVVRDRDELYVRSVRGPDGPWYRGARSRHAGRIHAGGVDRDVDFTDAGPDRDTTSRIDAAYRRKYASYPADIVASVLSPQARAATIRLVPR